MAVEKLLLRLKQQEFVDTLFFNAGHSLELEAADHFLLSGVQALEVAIRRDTDQINNGVVRALYRDQPVAFFQGAVWSLEA